MEATDAKQKARAAAMSAAAKTKPEKDDDALSRYLTEKGQFAFEHQEEIKEAFTHALPKILLFCLPFFALYARGLFRQTGYVYLQHFIVALHFHTFAYLWWLVLTGWAGLIGLAVPWVSGVVAFLAWLWMVVYPFLMMRRLFSQSWPRTIIKTAVLLLVYAITLWVSFVGTTIIVFLLL